MSLVSCSVLFERVTQPDCSIAVSVIVPTFNRPERLQHCLQALTQQTYSPQLFEVIVVDDGSQVPLLPVIQALDPVLNIKLLRQQNSGPAHARNQGARHASGRYLIFTDDDCIPTPDWLQCIVDPFTAQPESVVGGQTLNALPHNLYSTTSQLLVDYLYYYYNAEPGQTRFFTSNNFALSAQVFQQLSGFDVTFPLAAGEDRDLCDRLSQQGYRMDYVPTAQVLHAHELSLPKFWRQHFNYGRGAYHFHQVRSRRNAQPIKVEPFIFYIHLLTYPCQRAKLPSALLMVGLMVLSQLANVLGFVWQKYQSKPVKKA